MCLKNRTCIVDVQGFQYKQTRFICKELAIISIDNNLHTPQPKHYLFNYDFDENYLSDTFRKQINYLTINLHGLMWNNSEYDGKKSTVEEYYNLGHIIEKDVFQQYDLVLVKGLQKVNWLSGIINNNNIQIENIENFNCPNLCNLKRDNTKIVDRKRCYFHEGSRYQCALENVLLLHNWFSSNRKQKETNIKSGKYRKKYLLRNRIGRVNNMSVYYLGVNGLIPLTVEDIVNLSKCFTNSSTPLQDLYALEDLCDH